MFAVLLAASILPQTPNQAMGAARPTLIIRYPTANVLVTNSAITVTGKTQDKVAIASVYYRLSGEGWTLAATSNAWIKWTVRVTLNPGANCVQASATAPSARA